MKRRAKKTVRMPKDCREVQAAMDQASWDAVEGYRQTGEMVPTVKDGKLAFVTVDAQVKKRSRFTVPNSVTSVPPLSTRTVLTTLTEAELT